MLINKILYKCFGLKGKIWYLSNISFFKYKLKNKTQYSLLKQNIKYKNIHKNKRCFILGNGPSLKKQDLSLLENEIVFTVNNAFKLEDFEKIKTNYHFWADPVFFEIDENKQEDLELLNRMKSVKTNNNNPICFFDIYAFEFVNKFKLMDDLNISYYKPGFEIYEKFNEKIDYTKLVPAFATVVQYAVTMAIYMGCSEIYLLGCDMTGIINVVGSLSENFENSQYAYNSDKIDKYQWQKVIKHKSEDFFYTQYKAFRDYRILNNYCIKNNIRLYNATNGGILDSVKRIKYQDIVLMK